MTNNSHFPVHCLRGLLFLPALFFSFAYGMPQAVREAIEKLKSSDPITKATGALELRDWGSEARPAISFLIQALRDTTPLDKRERGFITLYSSPQREAELTLIEIGDRSLVDPVAPLLRDRDYHVRSAAVSILENLRDDRAVELLIGALKDDDVGVQWVAASALGRMGGAKAVTPLIEALRLRDTTAVIQALGKLRDEGAVEAILPFLRHKDAFVREIAVEALGRIGDIRVISALNESAQRDNAIEVRLEAAAALYALAYEKERQLDRLISAQNDTETADRAFRLLANAKAEVAVPKLIDILADPADDPGRPHKASQQEWAAAALVEILGKGAVPHLTKALQENTSECVRRTCARKLGELKVPSVVAPLVKALDDREAIVSDAAARALGSIRNPTAIQPLIELLSKKDKPGRVRDAATDALREITGQKFSGNEDEWKRWLKEHP